MGAITRRSWAGHPEPDRKRMFLPFQRFGDQSQQSHVGLWTRGVPRPGGDDGRLRASRRDSRRRPDHGRFNCPPRPPGWQPKPLTRNAEPDRGTVASRHLRRSASQFGSPTFPGEIFPAPRSWVEALLPPTSPTSTRPTEAATSRRGRSRSCSPPNCGRRSDRCANRSQPARTRPALRRKYEKSYGREGSCCSAHELPSGR